MIRYSVFILTTLVYLIVSGCFNSIETTHGVSMVNRSDIKHGHPLGANLVSDAGLSRILAEQYICYYYGAGAVSAQSPFNVVESDDKNTWIIKGNPTQKEGEKGGEFELHMRKKDGAIVSMIHER